VAAAGDVHATPERRAQVEESFAGLAGRADLLLLAGDLTTLGEPEQADVVARACRPLGIPVCAVLGNHDWHGNRRDEVVRALEEGGIVVLDRAWTIVDVDGTEVGVVGTKGFVGGFPGAEIADFGERLLREVFAETSREVAALEAGLEAIAGCERRLVLLHYAPVSETLVGEPEGIWAFLGSGRLAAPIGAHRPDAVFHGHAHHGRRTATIGTVPVHNVARQVIGGDFSIVRV
jgi:Icc-related predicted phosphoesterase